MRVEPVDPPFLGLAWRSHCFSLLLHRKLGPIAPVDPGPVIVPHLLVPEEPAHDYFVARLLGYEKVRNYDGSWIDWGNRPDLPLEK